MKIRYPIESVVQLGYSAGQLALLLEERLSSSMKKVWLG